MQVLGTVKNALVVWMGIIFLAELVTPLQVSPIYTCTYAHQAQLEPYGDISTHNATMLTGKHLGKQLY